MISRLGLGAMALLVLLAPACADESSRTAEPVQGVPTSSATARTADAVTDQIPSGLDPELVSVGQAFLRLARGVPDAALPVDTAPVTVLLGGAEAMSIDAAKTGDPRTWQRLCHRDGRGYAERTCPLSALAALREPGVVFSLEPAQEPCSRPHGLQPEDVGASRRVTLLAPGVGSCLDYAAVELYVNDVAQLVAVDLVLGSP